MDENDNNMFNKDAVKETASDVKNETIDAFNQVKDTVKNTDFKDEAKNTKGFLLDFIANPVGLLSSVANGLRSVLGTTLFFMIVWIVISFVDRFFDNIGLSYKFSTKLLYLVKSITTPILTILIPAIVIYVLNKDNKKSLLIVIQVLILAYVPIIINRVITFVGGILGHGVLGYLSYITSVLSAIATVLRFFGIKELYGEEDHAKAFKNFFWVTLITQVCFLILSILNLI